MFKNFLKEFKDFAEKGSAVDMAVGVIVGATMNGVVNSLVKDILMPPIGLLLGDVDFSQIFIVLRAPAGAGHINTLATAQSIGANTLNIGLFVNALISFLITMFAVFIFVRVMNKIRDKKVTTRNCPYCYAANVDVRATKCPNCCADIEPVPVQESKIKTDELIPVSKIRKKLKSLVTSS